ncbi:MAG: MFS transporter [Chloroflexi bacterium]|nr:MFS transporter [Chloroflexota bacterium]
MGVVVKAKSPNRIFYGWWIVLAGIGVNTYGAGAYQYGFGVFFKPIVEEFGWTRAATAAAFSMSSLEGGLEGPLIGPLIDKFGPRKIMIVGITLLSLGLLALSQINSLLTFYAVYVFLIAVGFNTGFHWATQTAIANWFIRKRGRALGLLSSAQGLGGSIMAPTLAWLVVQLGWRGSLILVGLTMFLFCIPLAMLVKHRPEEHGCLPDGEGEIQAPVAKGKPRAAEASRPEEAYFTLREAIRTRVWWQLALGFMLRSFGAGAVLVHQIPLLIDRGFDPQTAANMVGLVALMSVPGKVVFGSLADVLPKRHLVAIAYCMQGVALIILLRAQTIEEVYVFAALHGFGWGSGPVMMSLRGEYFGRRYFATIGGCNQAIVMLGHVVGPVFAGWIFDTTHSYNIAFAIFASTLFLGAVILFFAKRPRPPERMPTTCLPETPQSAA